MVIVVGVTWKMIKKSSLDSLRAESWVSLLSLTLRTSGWSSVCDSVGTTELP